MNDIYTILIVDDQRTNLLLIEAFIESNFDHKILKAMDAKSALDIVNKQQIDLIISDIEMPQMSGYEFAKELKKSSHTKDIPIVFVSALDKDYENEIKTSEAGAIDFISKPIDYALFIVNLKKYFEIVAMQYEIKRKKISIL